MRGAAFAVGPDSMRDLRSFTPLDWFGEFEHLFEVIYCVLCGADVVSGDWAAHGQAGPGSETDSRVVGQAFLYFFPRESVGFQSVFQDDSPTSASLASEEQVPSSDVDLFSTVAEGDGTEDSGADNGQRYTEDTDEADQDPLRSSHGCSSAGVLAVIAVKTSMASSLSPQVMCP